MMHRTMWFLTAAIAFVASALAAADTFLLVPGVPGDVTEKTHSGWIRVTTVDWQVEADTSWTRGGGASVHKPDPGAIHLTLPSGPWSTAFFRAITTGATVDKSTGNALIVEHVPVAGGRPAYRLTLRGFFVTKYRVQSEAQTPPLDSIEGVFKTISIDQFYTTPDGKVLSVNIAWDIPAGKVTPDLVPPAP